MSDLVKAIQELAAATQTLALTAGADHGPSGAVYAALLGAVVGASVTSLLGLMLEWIRRRRERRFLAVALRQELRDFRALSKEIKEQATSKEIALWPVAGFHTSRFDASGLRLPLLGKGLAEEVSECYAKVKIALNSVAVAQRIAEAAELDRSADVAKAAQQTASPAAGLCERAGCLIDKVLPKLE